MENKRLPHLCESVQCTACGACAQVCAQHAITMVADTHGFLHPHIDESACVGCLLCENKCPIDHDDNERNNKALKVVAAWHKDNDIRMTSSSGGVFTAISEYVLQKGGIVWGAAYEDGLHLSYQSVTDLDNLEKLRRSKYVQCEVGDAFLIIKEQLKSGKLVFFCGTSCHVRGLYQVVGNKLRDNLITADFICHGVPSPSVFAEYVKWIEKKYNDKLIDFNFRDKRYGWDNGVLTVGTFEKLGQRKFMDDENSYFTGMLNNMFIRDCCYQCSSNGLQRHSDFTIADFWGIGCDIPYSHQAEKTKGISMLAINSEKALNCFENYLQHRLNWEERSLEEAATGNSNYEYSSKPNPKADQFWRLFLQSSSWDGVVKFLRPTFVQRLKLIVKKTFNPQTTNKIRDSYRKLLGH